MSHLEQPDAVATSGDEAAQSQMHKEVFHLEDKFAASSSFVPDYQVEKVKGFLADAELTPEEARAITKMLLRNDQNGMTKAEEELKAKLKESGSSFELEIKPLIMDSIELSGIILELKDGQSADTLDKKTVRFFDGKVWEPKPEPRVELTPIESIEPDALVNTKPGAGLVRELRSIDDVIKQFADATLDGDLTPADARQMASFMKILQHDGLISERDGEQLENEINDLLGKSGSNFRIDIDSSRASVRDVGSVSFHVSDVTDPEFNDHVTAKVDNSRPLAQEGAGGRPIDDHPYPHVLPYIQPPGGKPIRIQPIGGKPVQSKSE